MKKFFLLIPLISFAYFYPFKYQFVFMRSCMSHSTLPNKYEYCRCVYEKVKATYPYNYFLWHQTDIDVLKKVAVFSKECLNKSN